MPKVISFATIMTYDKQNHCQFKKGQKSKIIKKKS